MSLRVIGVGVLTPLAALALLFGCTDLIEGRVAPLPADAFSDVGGSDANDPPDGAEPPGPDELCALHQRMTEAMNAVAGSTDPASGAVRVQALLDFHAAAAADVVDQADAAAFLAMRDYWDALGQWSEANGGELDPTVLATRPVVPADASRRTAELLEIRCGVVSPSE